MANVPDNIWENARQAFLPFDGVVGVGYGPKVAGGEVVARQAIVVLVEKKLRVAKIAKGQHIPSAFQGLPTDVRVPRLTPDTQETGPPASGDWCLRDYEWIDWPKIHRLRSEKRRGRG